MFTINQKIEKLRGEPRHLKRENLGSLRAKMGRQLIALKSINSGGVNRQRPVFEPKK